MRAKSIQSSSKGIIYLKEDRKVKMWKNRKRTIGEGICIIVIYWGVFINTWQDFSDLKKPRFINRL